MTLTYSIVSHREIYLCAPCSSFCVVTKDVYRSSWQVIIKVVTISFAFLMQPKPLDQNTSFAWFLLILFYFKSAYRIFMMVKEKIGVWLTLYWSSSKFASNIFRYICVSNIFQLLTNFLILHNTFSSKIYTWLF